MPAWWSRLSAETRVAIWDIVARSSKADQHRTMSKCAAVSTEWQWYFERANFKKLTLHQRDVLSLNQVVNQHRRKLVKHIWLRVTTPPYDYSPCPEQESESELQQDSVLFTNAFMQLMESLILWEEDGPHGVGKNGVMLQLSLHSPNDSKHCFRYLSGLGPDLADLTRNLDNLSVCFVTDAKDFFADFFPRCTPKPLDFGRLSVLEALMADFSSSRRRAVMKRISKGDERYGPSFWKEVIRAGGGIENFEMPKPSWPNLQSLVLTSSVFKKDPGSNIDGMLLAAAKAAMGMPKLQTMELWNASPGMGFVFKYQRTGRTSDPKITLSSTWGHKLSTRVIKAWSALHTPRYGQFIEFEERNMDPRDVLSCSSVIDMLDLRDQVMRPV